MYIQKFNSPQNTINHSQPPHPNTYTNTASWFIKLYIVADYMYKRRKIYFKIFNNTQTQIVGWTYKHTYYTALLLSVLCICIRLFCTCAFITYRKKTTFSIEKLVRENEISSMTSFSPRKRK